MEIDVKICKHCLITGKVQGVFYRQTTQEKAKALGLTGWVRNLPNGSVECVICGDEDAVQSLCDWLWLGSDAANVTDVKVNEHDFEAYQDFSIRF